MGNSEENKTANELYAYVKEFALLKLENETKREDSLIQQSANMQTAFSFTTAALLMVATIAAEYRGAMSLEFLLLAFSTITTLMLVSLVFASMAQNRQLNTTFPDIEVFTQQIEDKYTDYLTSAQRDKAIAELIGKVQKSKDEINDKRVKRIRWSMRFFYSALALTVFWFFVALCIMF
ncbi:MAG: hypothetical protein Q4C46_07340 [Bacillota bacterium]|nr:hypothetical protein [Bacillota bacterium]